MFKKRFLYFLILPIAVVLFIYVFKIETSHDKTRPLVYIDKSLRGEIEQEFKDDGLEYELTSDLLSADITVSSGSGNGEVVDDFKIKFAPVVHLRNDIENIKSSELKDVFSGELTTWQNFNVSSEGNISTMTIDSIRASESLKALLGVSDNRSKRIDSYENLISSISKERNALAIIPVDKLSPQVKVLSVDGQNIFKEDEYKFSLHFQLRAKDSGKNINVLEKLKEYSSRYKQKFTQIMSVGDMMLSRHVGTKIYEAKDNSLPFRKLGNLLSSADITFGNLESPFYDTSPRITEGMVFKAEPETIEGLKLAGFDIVSLANNHFGNQGRPGMSYTFDFLKDNNILFCGAGNNYEEAHSYKIVERNDQKFSFLSYNEISPETYKADEERAGLAWIKTEEEIAKMEKDVDEARANSDFVIVSFHWGTEYTPNPTDFQRQVAQRAVKAGADAIIAQHPHVVQAIEFIDGTPVFYSLGNFVFDQMWSEETREGYILNSYVYGDVFVSFDIIPIKIYDYNQPRLTDFNGSKVIKNRIFEASGI